MLIKVIGGCLVVFASVAAGFYYTNKMHKRIEFLEGFNHDIILLKSRIIERQRLMQAFRYVSKFSDFSELWLCWSRYMEDYDIKSAFKKSIIRYSEKFGLKKSDIKTAAMLANSLGTTDIEAQKEHIDYISGMIELVCSNARADYEKNCRLYKQGSILVGILTVIMLL